MKDMDPSGQTAALRRAIRGYLAALKRREMPDADLSELAEQDRYLIGDMIGLSRHILSRKKSLAEGIETLRDGFAIFGVDRDLVYANRAFRSFFAAAVRADRGVALEHLLQSVARYQMLDFSGSDVAAWMAEIRSGRNGSHVANLLDGRNLRVTIRNNEMGHLVLLATDITTEIRRQRELELARRQAEAAANAKTGFLAQMSHEFRTPMNGVIGMAELLCDSGLDPERQRYAETIRNSAEALLGIINDILDYARGSGGDLRLSERGFDLEAMTVEIGTLLQPAARAKGLDLRIFYDPLTPVNWIGDTGRLRQIILNLLGNAVKYTQRGWVRLQVIADSEQLHILVHDSGPGIPDDRADDIFREFSQLSEPGVTGVSGSGLGLAIASQLVAAMRGRLWLASQPGEGSTFGVSLPMRPVLSVPSVPVVSAVDLGPVLAFQRDRPLARHLHRLFAASGIPLSTCSDDAGLLARLRAGPAPRLILVFCGDHADHNTERIMLLRQIAPDAQIWLLQSASRHSLGAALADRVITLPVTRLDLTRAVITMRTGDSSSDQHAATPDVPAATDNAAGRPMQVLVADDNATNRLVIEKMLRHCDIDLTTAGDGQQAIDCWRSHCPDLILMDMSMPVMDGCDAARMIRQIEAAENLPRTRIVAVTAAADDEARVAVLRSGMDEVMIKPVRRAALLDLLRRFAPQDVRPPADAA